VSPDHRPYPYQVCTIRKLTEAEAGELPLLSRLKTPVHGNRQAFAINSQNCHGCEECIKACPGKAIKLEKVGSHIIP
jgi:NAD-dependent dihydropyrimidine dehydrogenase PreA subunit